MPAHLFGVSATPPSFVLSVRLIRVHSVPVSVSLWKTLNSVGPCIDPWDSSPVRSDVMQTE